MEEPSEAEMRDMSDRCEPEADEPHVLVSDPDQLLSVDTGLWPARLADNDWQVLSERLLLGKMRRCPTMERESLSLITLNISRHQMAGKR